MQLLVDGLPAGARLHIANGTNNGTPFVIYNNQLAPGASVDLTIEYRLMDRVNLPVPAYRAQVVDPLPPEPITGTPTRIDRNCPAL